MIINDFPTPSNKVTLSLDKLQGAHRQSLNLFSVRVAFEDGIAGLSAKDLLRRSWGLQRGKDMVSFEVGTLRGWQRSPLVLDVFLY